MHRPIAAVSMVILLGWTSGVQGKDLDKIEIDPDELTDGSDARIVVTAYDSSGNKLEGVTITLDGAGVSMMKKTTSRGEAVFNFTPDLHGDSYGEINVMAKYTGTITKEIPETIIVN